MKINTILYTIRHAFVVSISPCGNNMFLTFIHFLYTVPGNPH